MARWYPEADSGPSVELPAIAEEGRPPRIPAPLIRVPAGTVVRVTLRNALADSSVTFSGLQERPASKADSIRLRPGETRTVTFSAGAPGTYFYAATAGVVDEDVREREQLAGAFVVDTAGASPRDRVFVINIWGEPIDSTGYRNALTINGRGWPFSERITATAGDTLRWRWVNASVRPHPMHLHGFYFRIDAAGGELRDSVIGPDAKHLAVTDVMQPGDTRSYTWSPDREGNWLFHCHIGFHVVPETRFATMHKDATLSHDADEHMAGLVLGIVVRPRGAASTARVNPRPLRLFVQEGRRRGDAPRAMGYVLQQGGEPAADSVGIPGTMLVLTRGEPTDVTVHNRLREPTAVHWHGLELESYSDGVAGWSGVDTRIAPLIAPADSFIARLTVPRAGTFIYHTHLGDLEQLTSGLYGPLLVLEPGQRYDPAVDHVFISGWDGAAEPPRLLVNGDSLPAPVEFASGIAHRLRFINIGPAAPYQARLTRNASLATWRALARDGADLPPAQAVSTPAELLLDVGQTADVEFTPASPGTYRLTIALSAKLRPWELTIRVR
jgi:FtsP/CotA-like multicopper oxidase with cupredoxin domain